MLQHRLILGGFVATTALRAVQIGRAEDVLVAPSAATFYDIGAEGWHLIPKPLFSDLCSPRESAG